MKSNCVLYDGDKVCVDELLYRSRPFFMDVEVDSELYEHLNTEAYMPKVHDAEFLFNHRADTNMACATSA